MAKPNQLRNSTMTLRQLYEYSSVLNKINKQLGNMLKVLFKSF